MALCEISCTKGKLFAFNFLCWMSGCFLIIQGFWILVDATKIHLLQLLSPGIARHLVFSLTYGFFLLGCGMVSLAYLGCCCPLRTSKSMILLYLIKLSVLITVEIFVVIAILFYQSSVLADLKPRLLRSLATSYGHENNSNVNHYGDNVFTQSIDFSQYKFNCCGISSDNDYINTRWWNVSLASNEPRNVPLTCCVISNDDVMNSGSPIRVVQRVFHGTVEELWQHPQPRNEQECQSSNNDRRPARYKEGLSFEGLDFKDFSLRNGLFSFPDNMAAERMPNSYNNISDIDPHSRVRALVFSEYLSKTASSCLRPHNAFITLTVVT